MCELFGLASSHPLSFTCSLRRFAQHGNLKGPNHDGWGVAAYEGRDAFVLKEPTAAAQSAWERFMEHHGVTSPLVIAHIRHASVGARSFINTHPFHRELGGTRHVFAHNGDLADIQRKLSLSSSFRPIGETDSEYAFCALLNRLTSVWTGPGLPSAASRYKVVANFAAELARLGPSNFIYSDGDLLFAHGDRRRHDSGETRPPGLYLVERETAPGDDSWLVSGVEMSGAEAPVTILASVPLTDEPWRPLNQGELLMIDNGRVIG
jgi:glutamine amidotransferase